MKSALALISVGLLCAAGLAQTTPSTPEQNPATSPSTTQMPSPQASQPAEPKTMQPGTPPPTEPQNSGTSSNPATPMAPLSSASANQSPRIAPGSVIPVLLTKTVDAKKAKQGDEVHAKVTMDLKTNAGEVLVPKDTEVLGHVTEVQARNKEQKESQLGIVFDRTDTKSGAMQMPMSIQAIIGPQNGNANDSAAPDQSASSSPSPASTGVGGRSPMGSSSSSPAAPQPQPGLPSAGSGSGDQPANNARPQITGKTQGVVGIPNLKLEAGPNSASVLSSEKNNVKLESGTLLLLRVSQ